MRLVGPIVWAAILGVTALCNVSAQADDAEAVGRGITHAAAVAIFCSEKTQGEVGVPVPVVATYFREASTKFAERFGRPLDQVVDYAAATQAVRGDPSWIAAATRDEWPPTRDTELSNLTAASRGDFNAWIGEARPQPVLRRN